MAKLATERADWSALAGPCGDSVSDILLDRRLMWRMARKIGNRGLLTCRLLQDSHDLGLCFRFVPAPLTLSATNLNIAAETPVRCAKAGRAISA